MRYISDSNRPLYNEVWDRLAGTTAWKTRIRRCMPESSFSPPASVANLRAMEKALGHKIPDQLRSLLSVSNGVKTAYSDLIYSADRIVAVNLEMRRAEYLADRMPLDHLCFFGTVSDGDEFAFPICRNGVMGSAVFLWSHETDCREEYASSLIEYIVKYTVEIYTPFCRNRTRPSDG